ncbi:hypothetical protein ACFFF5_21245 [Lederbergia wuyishanensis]|uniref:Maturase K n=1 Tax=Lederbergia wuyishanensis TaxID=1347903 RepID=A0ABU0D793_9BACI|nr:hypothetical protein [Lederbergia wuyishanensis]MCJ8008942.1 hypothetical protein [Lederbergia wuyishanensis]MDQ0344270.1 hypothetical protein [Lederbergia wuyishanensis]
MPQQRLYHEFVGNQLIPYWYVLTFDYREIDWNKALYFYEAIWPFEFVERDEFDDSLISYPIYFSDFIFNNLSPNKIGINLKRVKKRMQMDNTDPCIVNQLIVPTYELIDLLHFLPSERKTEFAIIT